MIVDEAHTRHRRQRRGNQQQRYELVRDLAAAAERHLLLLTATPHSGIEDAFRSLLALLAPHFGRSRRGPHWARPIATSWPATLSSAGAPTWQRWLGEDDDPLPRARVGRGHLPARPRVGVPQAVRRCLRVHARAGARQHRRPGVVAQRARYWAALALLRCVMSSPAAAERPCSCASGPTRPLTGDDGPAASDDLSSYVYDPTEQESAQDLEPAHVVEQGSRKRRARPPAAASPSAPRTLKGGGDPKLLALVPVVDELLRDGLQPDRLLPLYRRPPTISPPSWAARSRAMAPICACSR